MPVFNARMYSVTPGCKADWHAVLGWAVREAGLDWAALDHDAPAPLSRLWARDDLGLAMMCGLPWALRSPRPVIVAAPVPAPTAYGGLPRYRSDIVVRTDVPARTLEDTFGGVAGYTLADSLSGGVAFAALLKPLQAARGAAPLYRQTVGGLIHARGVIEALADGRIDVGPLDSYCHDLLRRHEPALASQVRVIAHTPWRPIPPLVATAGLAPEVLARLRTALQASADEPALATRMERLLLGGFAVPAPDDYEPLKALAADVHDHWDQGEPDR
jgi:ABC-type phosphate/phosphonate transport system substrate-binding protein